MDTRLTADDTMKQLISFHQEKWALLSDSGAAKYLEGTAGGQGESGNGLLALLREMREEFEHHFAQEEQLLVPLTEPVLGQRVGPLADMLNQHKDLRELFAEMKPAGTKAAVPQAKIENLLLLLDDHLRRENFVLFPMVKEILLGRRG